MGKILSAENKKQVWISEDFAHGFFVLSDYAEVQCKITDYWMPEYERCIRWDDPEIGIKWGDKSKPGLSAKDKAGVLLNEAEIFQ